MKNLFSTAAILFLAAQSAQAATLAPADLTAGAVQSNNALVFFEGISTVRNDVIVDYTGASLTGTMRGSSDPAASATTLAAGTYASYVIHYDTPGTAVRRTTGSYDFGGEIIALIVSNGANANSVHLLNESAAVFGASGTVYEDDYTIRSESSDTFALNGTSINWSFQSSNHYLDQARVIVAIAEVPLPASSALLLAGLGFFAALRRRSKKSTTSYS